MRRRDALKSLAIGSALLGASDRATLAVEPKTGRKTDDEERRRRNLRIGESYGPFLGHLTATTAKVWYRAPQAGTFTLNIQGAPSDKPRTVEAVASADHDFCVVWSIDELQPDRDYAYSISSGGQSIVAGDEFKLRTPPPSNEPQTVRFAFASCASEKEGSRRAWRQMSAQNPQVVVLLGDTPYIDSTVLATQRTRYGQFAAVPEFAGLLQTRPLYGTWDDHDFGQDDSDGLLPGKENSRQAFIEYHALPSFGDGKSGIYTSFRRGGAEVFLLDTRTFAGAEPSPVDANQRTLLGEKQWQWLQAGLRASDAPFKILACGMIWNEATRPNKTDHWMHYPYEREALFRFLGENHITGVVLVAGDIHRSRALKHRVANVVGYEVFELITSPMHDSIIKAANAPHPDLLFDAGEPHSFLIVETDTMKSPPQLRARFLNAAGKESYSIVTAAD